MDENAEARIVETIRGQVPGARIIGEELSPAGDRNEAADPDGLTDGGTTFIVDPLDGTTNFLHGYPQYAVSIGVYHVGEPAAAVVLNVARGDLFTARAGNGAYLNGKRIEVSRPSSPDRALIGTGFPFKRPDMLPAYAKQFVEISRHTAGIRRAGSAALDLADVACGRFDGFWELDLAPWDVAAGMILIREAGGVVTDLSGNPGNPAYGPVVAGNPDIHLWLLDALRRAAGG